MKLYKLTDSNGQTKGGMQWGPGVTHKAIGKEKELCGPGWIHAYESPYLAVFMNPNHANFQNPRLWEAKGIIGANDNGLKSGCRSLTTVKEIPLPVASRAICVRFAIICSLEVYAASDFKTWADNWLRGEDRTAKSAWDMKSKLWNAADTDATDAAYVAAAAANAAAVNATDAANAYVAAAVAAAAAKIKKKIDFSALALRAFEEEKG